MFGLSRSELTGVLILMRRDEIYPLFFSFREEGLGCLPAILMLPRSVCIDGRPGVFYVFYVLFFGVIPCFPFGCGNGMDRYLYYLAFLFWRYGQSCTLVCM